MQLRVSIKNPWFILSNLMRHVGVSLTEVCNFRTKSPQAP